MWKLTALSRMAFAAGVVSMMLGVSAGFVSAALAAKPCEVVRSEAARHGPYSTLEHAVEESVGGETLTVKGTCEGDTTITKNKLTIEGRGSAPTLNGKNQVGEEGSVVTVDPAITATISGLTIEGGYAGDGGGIDDQGLLALSGSKVIRNTATSSGGGIYSAAGSLVVSNSTIMKNAAEFGGGIYSMFGSVTLNNAPVAENTATVSGGGIHNFQGKLALTGTSVAANKADSGGGIWNQEGELTLNWVSVRNNTNTGLSGGGIYNASGAIRVRDSTVSGNKAYFGGGIENWHGAVTLDDAIVGGNTAEGSGGGIANFGTLTLVGSTFSGNVAGSTGGGIFDAEGAVSLTDESKVVSNEAEAGGGAYLETPLALLTVTNSAVKLNTANKRGGGIFIYEGSASLSSGNVEKNIAIEEGGGIFNEKGALVLASFFIRNNKPDQCVGTGCP